MSCNCAEIPNIVRVEDHRSIERFDELEIGDWVRLVRCPSCAQLWSVDEFDKYQRQFAIKIPRQVDWREFDTTPFRRQYLVHSRGGLTAERCIWHNCERCRVKGVVYCADHLYQTGARE
jgi:hypothetical protein